MEAEKRKKPTFLRRDWQKRIKFGKTVKKNRKWRAAKGRHNKIRLSVKGYSKRPKIGYGSDNRIREKINNQTAIIVSNLNDISLLKKGDAVMISKIGKKKRTDIIKECETKGIIILNKYKKQAENESNK